MCQGAKGLEVFADLMEVLAGAPGGVSHAVALEDDQFTDAANRGGEHVAMGDDIAEQWMAHSGEQPGKASLHLSRPLSGEFGQISEADAVTVSLFDEHAVGFGQMLSQLEQVFDLASMGPTKGQWAWPGCGFGDRHGQRTQGGKWLKQREMARAGNTVVRYLFGILAGWRHPFKPGVKKC